MSSRRHPASVRAGVLSMEGGVLSMESVHVLQHRLAPALADDVVDVSVDFHADALARDGAPRHVRSAGAAARIVRVRVRVRRRLLFLLFVLFRRLLRLVVLLRLLLLRLFRLFFLDRLLLLFRLLLFNLVNLVAAVLVNLVAAFAVAVVLALPVGTRRVALPSRRRRGCTRRPRLLRAVHATLTTRDLGHADESTYEINHK
ncbi:hypothetical protein M885DRAFT_535077 [Pelagophyceae sp. CCMP2097]|nr:hypothetical protein M885DRAFT_535077 [Pelagophyceae sp. CCMP2097]